VTIRTLCGVAILLGVAAAILTPLQRPFQLPGLFAGAIGLLISLVAYILRLRVGEPHSITSKKTIGAFMLLGFTIIVVNLIGEIGNYSWQYVPRGLMELALILMLTLVSPAVTAKRGVTNGNT